MEKEPREFTTKRSFVEWVRQEASEWNFSDAPTLFLGYEPISWCLVASIGTTNERPEWAQHAIPTPRTVAEAGETWDRTHEPHLCLFFHVELPIGQIVVAVRQGIWRSIEEKYLPHTKELFSEVTYEEAKSLFSEHDTWKEMCDEVKLVGISCRILR